MDVADDWDVGHLPDTLEAESLRLEVISFVEAAATQDAAEDIKPELNALLETLHRCASLPSVSAVLARCLHRILQLVPERASVTLFELEAGTTLANAMSTQQSVARNSSMIITADLLNAGTSAGQPSSGGVRALSHSMSAISNIHYQAAIRNVSVSGPESASSTPSSNMSTSSTFTVTSASTAGSVAGSGTHRVRAGGSSEGAGDGGGRSRGNSVNVKAKGDVWWPARQAMFSLFEDYLQSLDAARSHAATDWDVMNALFLLLFEAPARSFALKCIMMLLKAPAKSTWSKVGLFTRYIEAFSPAKILQGADASNLLTDLLAGIREVLKVDPKHYQGLFVEGGCFVQIVSLLNEELSPGTGPGLCLDVIATLTELLAHNDASKAALRDCVNEGYSLLERLLMERYGGQPDLALLDALLDLLVDGDFNVPTNMVIQNDDAVILYFNILRKGSLDIEVSQLAIFERILEESTANCASCVRAGLMGLLLQWLAEMEGLAALEVSVSRLVQIVGSYSMSGKDLRTVFSLLRSTKEGYRPRHEQQLLRTLQAMVKEDGPPVFFELNGVDSGLEMTAPMRFPANRGFTFSCWVRVEGFPSSSSSSSATGSAAPPPSPVGFAGAMGLFSFFTDFDKGYMALIQETGIVIYMSHAKEHVIRVAFPFHTKRWHFLAITQNVGQLLSGASQVKVYVDGKLIDTVKSSYPKILDPLTKCTIASKCPLPPADGNTTPEQRARAGFAAPFRGQLGPCYLFDDVLTPLQVEGVFLLGPGYMYTFAASEFGQLPEVVVSHQLADANSGLSTRIMASYNAQASTGHFIYDTSPLLDQSTEQAVYDAQILPGVQFCYRQRVQDVIQCVGGIGVLFPLFTQLDQPLQPPSSLQDATSEATAVSVTPSPAVDEAINVQLALDIMGLLTAVLAGNHASQQYMVNIQGFACLGFLLQRVPTQHLTVEFVLALENLVGCVSQPQDRSLAYPLVREAISKLYLNPAIWIYTPYPVQRELYSSLLRQVDKDDQRMHSLCGLQQMLDLVRQYYWDKQMGGGLQLGAKPRVHPLTQKVIGTRPQPEDVGRIRLLLLAVAEHVARDGLTLADVKATVALLETGKDAAVLVDVLSLLLRLLGRKQRAVSLVDHVYSLGGCSIFLGLLSRPQESIRLLGLRLIGALLVATPHEKRAGKEPPSGNPLLAHERLYLERVALAPLFAAIEDSITVFPMTQAVWAALFDVLMGNAAPKERARYLPASRSSSESAPLEGSQLGVDSYFVLPQILRILFKMMLTCETAMRKEVLETIVRLLVSSPANCEVVAKEPTWQEWLLSLMAVVKSPSRGGKSRGVVVPEEEATGGGGGAGGRSPLESEGALVLTFFRLVHVHAVVNLKAGWRAVERTFDFVLTFSRRGVLPGLTVLRQMLADLLDAVLKECPSSLQLATQPCRDNCLYVLTLVEEVATKDTVKYQQALGDVPLEQAGSTAAPLAQAGRSLSTRRSDVQSLRLLVEDLMAEPPAVPSPSVDETASSLDGMNESPNGGSNRGSQQKKPSPPEEESESRRSVWRLYNLVFQFLAVLNGVDLRSGEQQEEEVQGPRMALQPQLSLPAKGKYMEQYAPVSFGQRARGLVESLNGPASVEAAGAFGGPSIQKGAEKALKMRGDKCPRVVLRLVLLYVYEAELGEAVECCRRIKKLLPQLMSIETDTVKNRLHHFLWTLKMARLKLPSLGQSERIPMVSSLIQATLESTKVLLATTMVDLKTAGEGKEQEAGAAIDRIINPERVTASMREASRAFDQMAQRVGEVEALLKELDDAGVLELAQERVLKEKRQSVLQELCAQEMQRRMTCRVQHEAGQQAISRQWNQMYRDLTSERGSWTPGRSPSDPPIRWKLDKMEDPVRRRPRLRPNYRFDAQLLLPPVDERGSNNSSESTAKEAESGGEDANLHARVIKGLMRGRSISGVDPMEESMIDATARDGGEEGGLEEVEELEEPNGAEPSPRTDSSAAATAATRGEAEGVEDQLVSSSACVLVTAKRKLAGRVEIKRFSIDFHSEFVVSGNGGSTVFDSDGSLRPAEGITHPINDLLKNSESTRERSASAASAGSHHGGGQGGALGHQRSNSVTGSLDLGKVVGLIPAAVAVQKDPDLLVDVKEHRRWVMAQVKAIHITRYLLQVSALEIFFVDSQPPIFLNFPSAAAAEDMAKRLGALANTAAKVVDKDRKVAVLDRRRAIARANEAKGQWKRREISNFEYLMTLNTLAGRSYNDIMQYPVFPWIIADYTSEELDLKNPATFRDLSKPVGALEERRFDTFLERYQNFNDPDIPSFFYGSHYSTAGIVLFYLIRLEPFSSLNRTLQGGKFDHADRMFHSVESTWSNCLTNTSDVKELIPEFYYHPEFLTNSNDYYLGAKQDGQLLGDVVLPKWAKGSQEEFVRKCREALECEYVCDHLHEWIDLIFGVKQSGPAAEEAGNLFYHLTYEGAVKLDSIHDPFERAAVEDQIANFGQTPVHLFFEPHVKRGPPNPPSRPLYYSPSSIVLTATMESSPVALPPYAALRAGSEPAAVLFVGVTDNKAVALTRGQMMTVRTWVSAAAQQQNAFTFSGTEPYFGFGDTLLTRRIGTPFSGAVKKVTSACIALLQAGGTSYLLTSGHWDNSFQCVGVSDGRTLRSLRQHNDVVTCLSVSSDGRTVATGSRDTTVMVWSVQLHGGSAGRSLYGSGTRDAVISDKPRAVLCGHDDAVTCVVVKNELDLVVSGSLDGTCIIHTLEQGRYVRSIEHPKNSPIDLLVVSIHGHIVIYSTEDLMLHVASINGKFLASQDVHGGLLTCMVASADNEFLVTGGEGGVVTVRHIHSLEIVRKFDGMGIPVTSIALTVEDCVLVGQEDGKLHVYATENQLIRKNTSHYYSQRP
eukprot:TRINITY_DN3000_c2_g1_i1.p1 TRINITY_DN3000_c2_g1~~TRINITY_DN3000_c2_g1_i1.p1  ORF type:complete len:2905 (-),score=592.76 TRINITY_DN3000_c2_g1_i1:326-8950(-)